MKAFARLLAGVLAVAILGSVALDRVVAFLITAAASQPLTPEERARPVLVLVFCLACVAFLGVWIIHSLRTRLQRLAVEAERVAAGGHELPIPSEAEDLVPVESSVDRMRRALLARIGETEGNLRLLASVLAGLREGILVVSPQRRILLLNDALRRILEVRPEIGPGSRLIDAAWDHPVLRAFDEALRSREPLSRRLRLPGGRAFELTMTPLPDAAGGHAGVIGLLFDITRLEALERVRRDFVADITHELRTPLASILAAVETLLGGALDSPTDARRFLRILSRNSRRMEAILSDLTDLSMIETGRIPLTLASLDVGSAIRETVEAMAPRAARRSIRIGIDVPEVLTLRADRRRFEQILVNLLDNAVKFTPEGGDVTIAARREDRSIMIAVDDSGPGIPPDSLDRVFHRFFQVDRSRDRKVPGTGLGLAIVKHLVQHHAGQIQAQNRPGGGARFVLRFPIAEGSI